jgi:hypothetical protein
VTTGNNLDELRREFRLEVDRLQREIRTLRHAFETQHAVNRQQTAEIDELYRWAAESTATARNHSKRLHLTYEVLEDAAKAHDRLAARFNSQGDLLLNSFMYLEDLCSHLYQRVFPRAMRTITHMSKITGPQALHSPLSLDYRKRPAP